MVTGKAKVAGVFGWPVSHSLSPRLHGFWLEKYGIDGAYLPFPSSPEDFVEALRALPKLGIKGANVTIPHKETTLKTVDHLDPQAKRIGAVNTVIVQEDGSLLGKNTDGYGFMANVKQGAPDWDPTAGPAVVLGAGGAARAIIVALQDAGVPEIVLTNRTREKAETLQAELGGQIRVIDWTKRDSCLDSCMTLVNTTALGMTGKPDLTINLDSLNLAAVVTDIVYTPLMTDLLKAAEARGNTVVDGLGMLLHQAAPGFEAWFGVKPEVTEDLRQFVLAQAKG